MTWIWTVAGLLLLAVAVYLAAGRVSRRRRVGEPADATMALREERLRLNKTREQLAEVTTHKEVHRELHTVSVPITREDLVVEKNGVEAARIPLREDRVAVSTRSVPLNEVSVYRREWEERQPVEAVLKKEVARIETIGDVPLSEGTSSGEGAHPPG